MYATGLGLRWPWNPQAALLVLGFLALQFCLSTIQQLF